MAEMKAEDIRKVYKDRKVGIIGTLKEYSVLIPLVEKEGELFVLYETRAKNGIRQAGEVCFPGGHMEKGESPREAALRETEEEIGIPSEEIEIIGQNDTLSNIGNGEFILYSFVGILSYEAYLNAKIEENEVSDIFLVPLDKWKHMPVEIYQKYTVPIMDPAFPYERVGISQNYKWGQNILPVLVSEYEGHIIWGMTLRITLSMVETLGMIPRRDWRFARVLED